MGKKNSSDHVQGFFLTWEKIVSARKEGCVVVGGFWLRVSIIVVTVGLAHLEFEGNLFLPYVSALIRMFKDTGCTRNTRRCHLFGPRIEKNA